MNIENKHVNRFEDKFIRSSGCWEWQNSLNDDGYGKFHLHGRKQLAHRVSYKIYKGEIPEELCVLHSCDNPKCVNPSHLFTGSHQDNMKDMRGKGRGNIGERHGLSVFNEKQIIEIRNLYPSLSYQKIADIYEVNKTTIEDIVKRNTWKYRFLEAWR